MVIRDIYSLKGSISVYIFLAVNSAQYSVSPGSQEEKNTLLNSIPLYPGLIPKYKKSSIPYMVTLMNDEEETRKKIMK